MQRTRSVPSKGTAVGTALVLAAGGVWVAQQLKQVDHDEGDHLLRAEITTTTTAIMALVVKTNVRGTIVNKTVGVSKLHVDDVVIYDHERVEAVLLGKQSASDKRVAVECVLRWDSIIVDSHPATVRPGDAEKTVKCTFNQR